MATIRFTATLARHRDTPVLQVRGGTVRAAIDEGLAEDPILRSYVVDEQGRLRKHVNIYVDGELVSDRVRLSDPVRPEAEIYVLQALSGG